MKEVDVTCPYCDELNPVNLGRFRELPVYDARDICKNCGNSYEFEIELIYSVESFKNE